MTNHDLQQQRRAAELEEKRFASAIQRCNDHIAKLDMMRPFHGQRSEFQAREREIRSNLDRAVAKHQAVRTKLVNLEAKEVERQTHHLRKLLQRETENATALERQRAETKARMLAIQEQLHLLERGLWRGQQPSPLTSSTAQGEGAKVLSHAPHANSQGQRFCAHADTLRRGTLLCSFTVDQDDGDFILNATAYDFHPKGGSPVLTVVYESVSNGEVEYAAMQLSDADLQRIFDRNTAIRVDAGDDFHRDEVDTNLSSLIANTRLDSKLSFDAIKSNRRQLATLLITRHIQAVRSLASSHVPVFGRYHLHVNENSEHRQNTSAARHHGRGQSATMDGTEATACSAVQQPSFLLHIPSHSRFQRIDLDVGHLPQPRTSPPPSQKDLQEQEQRDWAQEQLRRQMQQQRNAVSQPESGFDKRVRERRQRRKNDQQEAAERVRLAGSTQPGTSDRETPPEAASTVSVAVNEDPSVEPAIDSSLSDSGTARRQPSHAIPTESPVQLKKSPRQQSAPAASKPGSAKGISRRRSRIETGAVNPATGLGATGGPIKEAKFLPYELDVRTSSRPGTALSRPGSSRSRGQAPGKHSSTRNKSARRSEQKKNRPASGHSKTPEERQGIETAGAVGGNLPDGDALLTAQTLAQPGSLDLLEGDFAKEVESVQLFEEHGVASESDHVASAPSEVGVTGGAGPEFNGLDVNKSRQIESQTSTHENASSNEPEDIIEHLANDGSDCGQDSGANIWSDNLCVNDGNVRKRSPWSRTIAEGGQPYWYHVDTNETTWDRPDDYRTDDDYDYDDQDEEESAN